jgi:S1-C subfamily serine protease
MKIPDWLVYTLVLAVVVTTLFVRSGRDGEIEIGGHRLPNVTMPFAASERAHLGPVLPDSSKWDERVLVQVGEAENGLGTAFAINESGVWLTARHVVDGCAQVGLVVGGGRALEVDDFRTSPDSDLALLFTNRAPHALQLDLSRGLRVGETGYHIGYPQGRAGEATSVLLARSQLVTRGRYRLDEPVLAWEERTRSEGAEGTLAGMSGGPVFDDAGAVIGVTIAESPRRGRIYTASPDSISEFLDEQGLSAPGHDAVPVSAQTYSREADRLRREMAVVKVVCRVEDGE